MSHLYDHLCRGRLSLYGRRGVRDTDLNFPAETYSDAEIPGSIEQLQVFIKQDQVCLLVHTCSGMCMLRPFRSVIAS